MQICWKTPRFWAAIVKVVFLGIDGDSRNCTGSVFQQTCSVLWLAFWLNITIFYQQYFELFWNHPIFGTKGMVLLKGVRFSAKYGVHRALVEACVVWKYQQKETLIVKFSPGCTDPFRETQVNWICFHKLSDLWFTWLVFHFCEIVPAFN